ncbi:hypothetical protein M758_7G097300 [Ceratodon purpureus]|uniref:Uncharacterized protein n=1 Tax=Ceratodon purpureus TaxID=3225 RepID=A0A8T0H6Y8_CERPU|nr:hypothetical protein KC19_7G103100 [Ceratodon purpureus]KAG0610856.1 hypothetical protein M758_7G097300 [Ceratodon purpureus]
MLLLRMPHLLLSSMLNPSRSTKPPCQTTPKPQSHELPSPSSHRTIPIRCRHRPTSSPKIPYQAPHLTIRKLQKTNNITHSQIVLTQNKPHHPAFLNTPNCKTPLLQPHKRHHLQKIPPI